MSDAVQVLVGVTNGRVEMSMREDSSGRFAQGGFDPQNAWQLGKQLCESALLAKGGGKGTDKDHEFVDGELMQVRIKIDDAKRDYLIAKVATAIRTHSDNIGMKKSVYLATHAVDEVLKETAR